MKKRRPRKPRRSMISAYNFIVGLSGTRPYFKVGTPDSLTFYESKKLYDWLTRYLAWAEWEGKK